MIFGRWTPLVGASLLGGLSLMDRAHGQAASSPPADIGTAQAIGSGLAAPGAEAPQTAAGFAPSAPSLSQIQPTSTLKSEALQKIVVPTENYNDIVRLTPSAMDISPVGPGLQQDFGQSIRGLQYTQVSVLYDGIPVPGFPFNFAPQPAIYFTSRDIGSITVNRGPGQASAIGAATFGGSIALGSPALSAAPTASLYGTAGSYGTLLGGVQAETGAIAGLNGGRVMINLENLQAGGATSNTGTARHNGFLKYEQPVGDNTLVTALVNVDHTFTYTPYGATLANIQAFGRNYALNTDPASQSFKGYNHDDYKTDFEYINVKSDLGGGFTIDNTVYSTSYYQHSYHGMDVGGLGPNLSGTNYLNGIAPADLTGDVPAFFTKYYFRNTGDILRLSKDTPYGQLRVGVWGEHEAFATDTVTVDGSRGFVPYTAAPGSIYANQFSSPLDTIQPYAEFAWKALSNLTVTAGLKYSLVTRSLTGAAGLTGLPENVSQSYATPLPALDMNWRVTEWAAVFAQAARGFETPNLNLFSTTQLTVVSPSTTNSYQVGGVVNRPAYAVGADLYYIQYDNYVNNRTVGGFTTYFNQGGATYKGVEVEGTVKLRPGLAFYANGSLNDSNYTTNGNVLAQTPRYTAALGPIFDKGGVFRDHDDLFASVIGKFVGPQYGLDTAAAGQGDSIPIKAYKQVDLAAGYTLPVGAQRVLFKLNLYNLLDDKSIIGFAGQTIGPPSQPLYYTAPGRSVFFTLGAKI